MGMKFRRRVQRVPEAFTYCAISIGAQPQKKTKMQLKKMLPLFIVLVFAIVGIFGFFIFRHRNAAQNLTLGQFAKLPEQPNSITEFEHGPAAAMVAFSPVDPSLIAVAFSPPDYKIDGAIGDGIIKLWNRNDTSEPEPTFTDHTDTITSIVFSPTRQFLAFSPTRQFLASGSLDGTIILWDVSRKRPIKSLKHRFDGTLSHVSAISFSPDRKWLVSAGMNVKFWNVTDIRNPTEGPTLTHDSWVQAVDFSSDGKFLAAGDQRGNVKIWDVQNKQIIKTLKRDSEGISTVKFSSDNRLLVTGGKFYISLWHLPNWHLHGTIPYFGLVWSSLSRNKKKLLDLFPRLALSRDGKVLAMSRSDTITELRSVETGAHIASLKGNTKFPHDFTFSSDNTALASIGSDGTLRIWDVTPYLAQQQLDASPKVRLIYFVPSNRRPQPNIRATIDELIKKTQQFYADEMGRHGFSKKTFDFEKDGNGKAVVYRVDGKFTDEYYLEDPSSRFTEEYEQFFDYNSQNVWLFFVDSERIGEAQGMGGLITSVGVGETAHARVSYALIPTSGAGFRVSTMAHELGHAFGLEHDFREHNSSEGSYIMSYDRVSPYRLSKGAAEWLDKSRFFNHNRTFFNEPSTIIGQSNKTQLLFELKDMDGLHQVQLAVPATARDFGPMVESYWEANPALKKEKLLSLREEENAKLYPDEFLWVRFVTKEAQKIASIPGTKWKLHSYQQLKGQETATVEFELAAGLVEKIRLQVIDEGGNIAKREFDFTENSEEQPESP